MLAYKCMYTYIMTKLYSTIENTTNYQVGLLAFKFNQMFCKLTLGEMQLTFITLTTQKFCTNIYEQYLQKVRFGQPIRIVIILHQIYMLDYRPKFYYAQSQNNNCCMYRVVKIKQKEIKLLLIILKLRLYLMNSLYFVRMNLYTNVPIDSSFSVTQLYAKYFDAVFTYQHRQL